MRILLPIQTEPVIHGVVVANRRLLRSLGERNDVGITHIPKLLSHSVAEIGTMRPRKVGAAVRILRDVRRALPRHDWLWLTPAPSGKSLLLDAMLALMATRLGTRVALHLHGIGWAAASGHPVFGLPVRLLFRYASAVIVLAPSLREDLGALADGKAILTLPNCILLPSWQELVPLRAAAEGPTILFMAALMRSKGIYDAIDIVRTLSSRDVPRVRFLVAGSPTSEMDARAIESILHHDLPSGTSYLGFLTGARKFRVLGSATALLFPSYLDTFPLTVIEALAHGTPVVAYATGAIPDILAGVPGCRVVSPGDKQGAMEALLALCRSFSSDRIAQAKACRTRASEFDCNNYQRHLDRVLEGLRDILDGGMESR